MAEPTPDARPEKRPRLNSTAFAAGDSRLLWAHADYNDHAQIHYEWHRVASEYNATVGHDVVTVVLLQSPDGRVGVGLRCNVCGEPPIPPRRKPHIDGNGVRVHRVGAGKNTPRAEQKAWNDFSTRIPTIAQFVKSKAHCQTCTHKTKLVRFPCPRPRASPGSLALVIALALCVSGKD
jgi:hypothetical protein